jgi:hypothetical protein
LDNTVFFRRKSIACREEPLGELHHAVALDAASIRLRVGIEIAERGVHTSLRTDPWIGECGALNVELGLAKPALASRATGIFKVCWIAASRRSGCRLVRGMTH